jgi:anaerobic selenocysteine-containing dehydrogenase
MRTIPKEDNGKTSDPRITKGATEMENFTITRRDFLKASAVTGAVAALYSSDRFPLKGLAEARESAAGVGEVKVLKSACRSCAHGACEVLVHVREGQVVKIEPDLAKGTIGAMCSKGQAAIQQLYNPNRIKYPMKRVGARGEGKWQRISWDEALDTISKKWLEIKEKYGPEAIFWAAGTGRNPDRRPMARLAGNFGIANSMSPGHLCHSCRMGINESTLGIAGISSADYEDSKCIVFPGAGLFYTQPETAKKIDAIMKAQKVIVVDPVFREIASKAHIWLQVRPGTDCAWMLAWLNVIIGEDLYDRAFVEQWTNAPFLVVIDPKKPLRGLGEVPGTLLTEADIKPDGKPTRYMVWDEATKSLKYWDATTGVFAWEAPGTKPALFGTYKVKLKDAREVECKPAWQILWDRVEDWTPEKAAGITWIPADKIREAARTYATIKPASIVWGVAKDMSVTMAQSARIESFLMAITGNINVKGGDWEAGQTAPGYRLEQSLPPIRALSPEALAKRLGVEEYPFLARLTGGREYAPLHILVKALLTGKPYKPKAMIVWTSTLICYANQKPWWKAMEEWEFVVYFDFFMNPGTHLIADIVLPTTHWLEENNIDTSGSRIKIRQRTAGPLWECLSDDEFGYRLGRRLGLAEYYPWKTEEEFWNECVKGTGVTFEELKKISPIPAGPKRYKSYEKGLYRRDQKPGFATLTGKVEIYSTLLKDQGYDPLYIHYVEPHESPYSTPELAKEYPLVLTTGGRSWHFFHTEQRQIPFLREIHPVPDMYINPKTANELGIQDGDWVWIENQRGRVRQKAKFYEGIHPRVVHARHHWWYPEKPATKENPYGIWDSNINVLTDSEHTCAVMASEQVRGLLCKVYKAVEGAPEGVWTKPEQFKPWLPQPPRGE